MMKQNLSRPIQIKFRVNEHERDVIHHRMQKMKIDNLGLYMRKVSLGTPLYVVDLSEINEMCHDITAISRNINQIARRINADDTVYAEDVRQIKRQQDEIWSILKKILTRLP